MPRTYNVPDLERGLGKLTRIHDRDTGQGLDITPVGERWGYYWVNGKRQFPVSAKHHTAGDVPKGRAQSIRKQLKLDNDEFANLCDCPLSAQEYHELIISRLGIDASGNATDPDWRP